MRPFRVALFLVATLAVWSLGNFALRSLWVIAGLPTSTVTTRILNVALLLVAAAVAWLILRRVPEDDGPRRPSDPEAGGR